jgi:hypothetical protein
MHIRTYAVAVAAFATLAANVSAQDWDREWRERRHEGVHIRIGRDYQLPSDQVASRPVIVVGGSATVDGRLEDDLVVVGGPVTIGPHAKVRGNVVALGGEVRVADTAEVQGEIRDVGIEWPEIRFALRELWWRMDEGWWAGIRLVGTTVRYVLTMLAACLIALIAPGWIRRIQGRAADAPLASALTGLVGEVLLIPAIVVVVVGLVLTIVGIPLLALLPFALFAFGLAWLAGFAAVAARLGALTRGRFGEGTAVMDVARGVTLLFVLTVVGRLLAVGPSSVWPLSMSFSVAGFVVEFLAWTVGLGAALLAPFGRRWRVEPPPLHSAASVNA